MPQGQQSADNGRIQKGNEGEKKNRRQTEHNIRLNVSRFSFVRLFLLPKKCVGVRVCVCCRCRCVIVTTERPKLIFKANALHHTGEKGEKAAPDEMKKSSVSAYSVSALNVFACEINLFVPGDWIRRNGLGARKLDILRAAPKIYLNEIIIYHVANN